MDREHRPGPSSGERDHSPGHSPADSPAISAEHTACFEAQRRRLHGVAYRMLGSVSDADDAVQDGWLRWFGLGDTGRRAVTNPPGWMTTTVSRLALDRLKSAAHRRETYVGPWLPEPVLDADPQSTVELAESLTVGFLTMLERLGPVERAVFLLVDVFAEPYSAVAEVVGRSEAACRQVASRARRKLRHDGGSGRTLHPARRAVAGREGVRSDTGAAHAELLVQAFLGACIVGELDTLQSLLIDDVVVRSDGGGLVHAARRPVVGADRAARFLANIAARLPADGHAEVCAVNGQPGLVLWQHRRVAAVIAFEMCGEQIAVVDIIVNPDKLRHLSLQPGDTSTVGAATESGNDRNRNP